MEQSERKALGGAVPVATLGQGDGPQAQSPRRGRKENPREPVATSSAAQASEPVQLALFDRLGPAMPQTIYRHPLYAVWQTMRRRCGDPRHEKFPIYGGRGIVVCSEWQTSSRAFFAWALSNGWQPGLQIDRRDNDGPYSPDNCRFVTRSMNRLNLRCTIRLADGQPALPVARRFGISSETLRGRIRRGWTPEQAAGIAPPPPDRAVRLSDGRPARSVARTNGIACNVFGGRIRRGWTPEQAAGIAPPPQRRQKAAGQAQPASDGRRRRKTDKPASQPSPGRCEATKQKRGAQDE